MPTIAWFYGILIQMHYDDHAPPHFHARYGGAKAMVGLSDGAIIAGELPPTAARMVRQWARQWALSVGSVSGIWRESRNCRIIGSVPLCTCLWKKLPAPMTTNDWPMVDVLRVKALDGHRLWVRFSDGNEGVRDFSDIIAAGGPMVEPLKAPDYFARAFVEMGVPTWPNGFDLDPVNLYMQLRDAGALTRAAAE
jgi:hypothetical protein